MHYMFRLESGLTLPLGAHQVYLPRAPQSKASPDLSAG